MTAPKLTKQQLLILGMVADGLSVDEIAARLFVSRNTVKTHLRLLLPRLGATCRAHAVAIALRSGLLPLPCGPIRREDEPYDPPADPGDPFRYPLGAGLPRTFPRSQP